jgi:hypothetical protein
MNRSVVMPKVGKSWLILNAHPYKQKPISGAPTA